MTNLDAFNHTAYQKLFQQIKKKYYSLGRMRGTIHLNNFSQNEVEEIASFLGVSAIQLTQKGNFTVQQFEAQLETSAFAHITLIELVEAVLKEKLQTKEQQKHEQQMAQQSFIEQLQLRLSNHPRWLAQIEKQPPDSRFIWQQQERILPEIEVVAKAISEHVAKEQFERLPLFAQRATGNPHAFDQNTVAGKLLVHAAFSMNDTELTYPKTTEERVDLLATLNIVQDDLWNFVTFQGLLGNVNQDIHPVWQAAITAKSALNMPMRELMNITRAYPVQGNEVWIVENSSVASTLMDANPNAPIICTHGQLRMASWRLFSLLDEHIKLNYAGDLDPEGIRIAQNIVNRYGERVVLWRIDEACYESGMSEPLTDERIAKLQTVTILPKVVEQLRTYRKAAYQEAWVERLIEDIGGE